MGKVIVITGASSGIGLAAAERFVRNGDRVYGLSRSGVTASGAAGMVCDVTRREALVQVMADIAALEGRIDVLISNAGMGISGAAEFTGEADARRILDVNFFGALFAAQAALPYLRAAKGRLVFVSSVAAPIAIPYQAFYSASKSALNSLALAMRSELAHTGVKVAVVMPGDASTGFTDARNKSMAGSDVYPHIASAVASMEKDERGGMTPQAVAGVLFAAAQSPNPKPLTVAGGKYKLFYLIFKLLPARLSCWIVGKMYS